MRTPGATTSPEPSESPYICLGGSYSAAQKPKLGCRLRRLHAVLESRAATHETSSDLSTSARHGSSDPPVVLRARIRRYEEMAAGMGRPVTASLTDEQTRELLFATVCFHFTQSAPALYEACRQTAHEFLMHGCVGRIVGPYRQRAEYVGFGSARRRFHALRQYAVENLPASTLSRLYQPTGELRTTLRRKRKQIGCRRPNRDAAYRNKLLRPPVAAFLTRLGKTCVTTSPSGSTMPATMSQAGSHPAVTC